MHTILFVRLEPLRGSERRVVRIVGMVGLTLDKTQKLKTINLRMNNIIVGHQ